MILSNDEHRALQNLSQAGKTVPLENDSKSTTDELLNTIPSSYEMLCGEHQMECRNEFSFEFIQAQAERQTTLNTTLSGYIGRPDREKIPKEMKNNR